MNVLPPNIISIVLFLIAFIIAEASVDRVASPFDKPFDYIQPLQHVKDVDGSYVAEPDIQLKESTSNSGERFGSHESSGSEEKANKKNCIPREEAAAAKTHVGGWNAEYDPDYEHIKASETIVDDPHNDKNNQLILRKIADKIQVSFTHFIEKFQIYGKLRFVFNDTSSSNVTDVGERVELKIIRPLCDD